MTSALSKAFHPSHLHEIWETRRQNLTRSCSGVDRISGEDFSKNLRYSLASTRERALKNYKPQGLLTVLTPKSAGGFRVICVPTISDRIVQFALQKEISPTLKEKGLLNEVSYGIVSKSNRTVQDARTAAIKMRSASPWVYKCDIVKFFDNIPRTELKRATRGLIRARSIHPLLDAIIDCEISNGITSDWQTIVQENGIKNGIGIRQGMPLSPFFAAILLNKFDKRIIDRKYKAIRYVDDIVAFFDSREECFEFHKFVSDELSRLGLSIGELDAPGSKTNVSAPKEPVEFLGMELRLERENYGLFVPVSTTNKIDSKIFNECDKKNIIKNSYSIKDLILRLDSIKRGYVAAYSGAQNMDQFKNYINVSCDTAIVEAVRQILKIDASDLSDMQKRFLGISTDTDKPSPSERKKR